ncbi:solute carrier family 66 member 3 [Neocloeon triangulifer]|uniref:solute carrier family 66 member 3 n=1 Tax=Neocloeon triangulifer TaxID=2078957 RepID=UPI00286ECF7B|nr:solute carrier family 66 member 3 [Neocloeon triangulifer]
MDILHMISDVLSIITISLCLILKVPQILNLYKLKSAKGMNLPGLFLELTSYTVMTCYNYCNNYSLMSYMEYPIILFQELILIFLVLKYKNLVNTTSIAGFGVYLAILAAFALRIVPTVVLSFMAPLCTPISASSKIVQLVALLRSKDSESISVLTWFLSAFTNFSRIFTIYLDSADLTLLTNFGISTFLSTSMMVATIYYKNPKKEKEF